MASGWSCGSVPSGEHRKEAKAAVFINGDGRLGFHCFSDDHAGRGWKELRAKLDFAALAQSNGAGAHPGAPAVEQSVSSPEPARKWPEALGADAFYGLAGEFVALTKPHTEADPAALLLQFLVMFGCYVGRGPRRLAGKQEHHLNEYVVIVGPTKIGRKGTGYSELSGSCVWSIGTGSMVTRAAA